MTRVVPPDVYRLMQLHSPSGGEAWEFPAVAGGYEVEFPDRLAAIVEGDREPGESFDDALRRQLTAMAEAEGIDVPATAEWLH